MDFRPMYEQERAELKRRAKQMTDRVCAEMMSDNTAGVDDVHALDRERRSVCLVERLGHSLATEIDLGSRAGLVPVLAPPRHG